MDAGITSPLIRLLLFFLGGFATTGTVRDEGAGVVGMVVGPDGLDRGSLILVRERFRLLKEERRRGLFKDMLVSESIMNLNGNVG